MLRSSKQFLYNNNAIVISLSFLIMLILMIAGMGTGIWFLNTLKMTLVAVVLTMILLIVALALIYMIIRGGRPKAGKLIRFPKIMKKSEGR